MEISNLYKTELRLNKQIPEQAEAADRIQNRPKELSITQFVAKAIVAYGKDNDHETPSISKDDIYGIVKDAMKDCLSELKSGEPGEPDEEGNTKDIALDSDMLEDLEKLF